MTKPFIKSFTIDRKKWGKNLLKNHTENGDGKMCCLGFYCVAQGVEPKHIDGLGMPIDLVSDYSAVRGEYKSALPAWIIADSEVDSCNKNHNSKFVHDVNLLATINDSGLKRSEKEKSIRAVFRKHGIRVRFIN